MSADRSAKAPQYFSPPPLPGGVSAPAIFPVTAYAPPPLPGLPVAPAAPISAPLPADFAYVNAPSRWTSGDQFDNFLKWCLRSEINDVSLGTGKRTLCKRHGRYRPVTANDLKSPDIDTIFKRVKEGAALPMGDTYRGAYSVFLDQAERLRLRVRVTICHTTGDTSGMQIALRMISSTPPSLEQIKMPRYLADMFDFKYGLGLICGKMESGKTWSLAAIIRHWLSNPDVDIKILHFGSPIEFLFDTVPGKDHIYQIEIPTAISSYPLALKMAKSATPDRIIVEEVNDTETMAMVSDAAQSGIGAYASIHISKAADLPGAMMTYFPEADQREARLHAIIDSLQVILVQRLEPEIIDGDPNRPGGRVCLREYLALDDGLRRKITSHPTREWSRVIDDLVGGHGCRMVDSARDLHKEGRISDAQLTRIIDGRG